MGYRVVRFTFRQIRYEPGAVAATLRKPLAQERSINSTL
jgi:hypothetical protein